MIGVDIGGSRIKLADVDGAKIRKQEVIPTPAGVAPAEFLDTLTRTIRALVPSPTAIGLAIPGEVDRNGRCYRLPNIPGFEGVALAAELEHRLGARVVVENDATAAALGEARFGHGRTHASFLIVTLGTGIGGGLVLDRRLVRGTNGFAGEIGHVTVDISPTAPGCVCGNRGCLESFTSARALVERARRDGVPANDAGDVAEAARRGNASALAAFETMADMFAVALNSIQNVLDLDAIVFSGGVSNAFDLVESRLREKMRARCYAKPLAEVPLLVSELGEHAGVIGAAQLPDLPLGPFAFGVRA
jgi:glucokinase